MNAEVFVLWDIYLIGAGFISYPQWEFPWEGILAGIHMSEALTPGLWAGCLLWAWQHRDRSEVTIRDPGAVSVSNAAFVNIIGQSQSLHPPL